MINLDSTIRIDRPAEEVFDFVADPTNDTKWHHNVIAARRIDDGPLRVGSRFEWDAKFLGRRKTDIRIKRYERPREVEMSLVAGWMKADVSYFVSPDDGGSRVTRRVAVPVPRALAFTSPLVRYFGNRSGEHHVVWLRDVLEGKVAPGAHLHAHGHGH